MPVQSGWQGAALIGAVVIFNMAKASTKLTGRKSGPLLPGVWEGPTVSRAIPRNVELMLWGRAAGRCQFPDCNKLLSRSPVSQEQVNIAEKAHIYAFSETGPRGHDGVAIEDLNVLGNLMLVCHDCHRTVDEDKTGIRYSAALLREWKALHETRIEIVTGIPPGRRSHVLYYGANVGEHRTPPVFTGAMGAMFPNRFPAELHPIALDVLDSPLEDRTPEFWKCESEGLAAKFDRRVRDLVARGKVDHLSVFALAPQPLLILLGTMLGDITPADVYQRHREPQTWSWPTSASPLMFEVKEPTNTSGHPALVLAVSATVTCDPIEAVLGTDASIWTVTIPQPNNDPVKSREDLSRFRQLVRSLFDRIKAIHGQTTVLHVFPAAPASLCVEFGRARMPKADMTWEIYDQNKQHGFVSSINIPLGG
jgi:SMODS-associated and fused to various effectors sensor domain